ncbi:MAG: superoxide dismutase [Candidatus Omnitrophica bacterium]|nr:superoxide dismutase [Candidatus Omnitrophota bacterium]
MAAISTAALTVRIPPSAAAAQPASGNTDPTGPFVLPPLPYAYDALEPYIDEQTMRIHHDKHHAAYVANLNKAVTGWDGLDDKSIEDLIRSLAGVPENIRTAVRNQGGGHLNHSLFWQMMSPHGGGEPQGDLATALEKKFDSFAGFKSAFTKAASALFGSGWVWLTIGDSKELRLEPTANQDSPLTAGRTPLLGIDLWEHAYYLKHQNRRADYIAAFYHVINWDDVQKRYHDAI